jgi:hypothetical protein
MSVSDWHQQQLIGMAAMMQRLGLDLLGKAPCRRAPAAAIDVCRNCASRDSCRGWLAPEDIIPDVRPAFCPKAQRLADLMADLEYIAPGATRH